MPEVTKKPLVALMPDSASKTGLPLVSIVTPFYNEEDGIEAYFTAIMDVINSIISVQFEIICIDDGSKDGTLQLLQEFSSENPCIRVIELSRNFGKEAALSAGLDYSRGDAVIPMDADLQDPPILIKALIAKWQEGFDVVLAKRVNRQVDTFLKRKTALWFYRLHNAVSNINIPENVGDFRLMNRAVVETLKELPEQNRFMKGLFAWVGYKTTEIEYVRETRAAGETKFSGWKLWNLAIEGITSFSTIPLRLWTYVGILISFFSFSFVAFVLIRTMLGYGITPGYASLISAILFIGGLQLISIGVLGEYIGRIYMESKRRPTYIVRRIIENKN